MDETCLCTEAVLRLKKIGGLILFYLSDIETIHL